MKELSFKKIIIILLLVVAGSFLVFGDGLVRDIKVQFGIVPVSAPDFKSASSSQQMAWLDEWAKDIQFSKLQNYIFNEVYKKDHFKPHRLAHKLGEIAAEKHGVDGFSVCGLDFQYGCLHGVVIELLKKHGEYGSEFSKELRELCMSQAEYPGQCIHGLGHSLVVITGYDNTPKAFRLCDELVEKENYRESCYDGVAMENSQQQVATQYEDLSARKHGYPCKELSDPGYKRYCVGYEMSIESIRNNWSFREGLDQCLTSYENDLVRHYCLSAVSFLMTQDKLKKGLSNDDIVSRCRRAGDYFDGCLLGAAKYLAWVRKDARKEELCKLIEISDIKEECRKGIKA